MRARHIAILGGTILSCAISVSILLLRPKVVLPPFLPAMSIAGPSLAPHAVLALGDGPGPGELSVVAYSGRVEVLEAKTGRFIRQVETGARGWTESFPTPREATAHTAHDRNYSIPDPMVLAGSPVIAGPGGIVAVEGENLREFPADGPPRILRTARWLVGARLVARASPAEPVFVVLADRRLVRIDGKADAFTEALLPGLPTAIAVGGAGGPVVVGGTDILWELIDGGTLRTLQRIGLRSGPPPVTALSLVDGSTRLVMTTAFATELERFQLKPDPWRVASRQDQRNGFKGPPALSVAVQPGADRVVVAKCRGGYGLLEPGQYTGFPRGTTGAPSRAIALVAGGTLCVQGWDDGELQAIAFPSETKAWRREGEPTPEPPDVLPTDGK